MSATINKKELKRVNSNNMIKPVKKRNVFSKFKSNSTSEKLTSFAELENSYLKDPKCKVSIEGVAWFLLSKITTSGAKITEIVLSSREELKKLEIDEDLDFQSIVNDAKYICETVHDKNVFFFNLRSFLQTKLLLIFGTILKM